MKALKCCDCKKEFTQRKLSRIKEEWYCKSCYKQLRKKHREQTIKEAGIENQLEELRIKARREYEIKHKEKVRKKKPVVLEKVIPKRANWKKVRESNNNYITLAEKQVLFSHLMKSGLDFYQAKERMSKLNESLKNLREKLKEEKLPEAEIKTKQQKMIEQLYASVTLK